MQLKRGNVSRRGVLRLIAALSVTAVGVTPAHAETSTDLANAQSQLASAQSQLDTIAGEYEVLSQKQSATLDDINEVEKSIGKIEKNIDVIEERLSTKRDKLSRNVADEYKDGNRGVVDLVVGSTSIEDVISGLYYYDKVTEEQSRLIRDVQNEREQLSRERDQLNERYQKLKEASRVQEEQLEAMRDKQLDAQKVVDGLSSDVRALLVKQEAELLGAQQEAAQARKARENAQQAQTGQKTEKQEQSAQDAAKQPEQSTTESKPQQQPQPQPDAESEQQPERLAESQPQRQDESAPEPEPEQTSDSDAQNQGEDEPQQKLGSEDESVPQGLGDGGSGTGSAAAVIAACQSTPSPGGGLCAAWCSNVMMNAGFEFISGNANDMYAEYCYSSDPADLRPGMAVAVSTHPHTSAGRIYGHIGMYIGDGMVMDNIGYIRTISLDEWIAYYGETVPVRWGWLGGIVLN